MVWHGMVWQVNYNLLKKRIHTLTHCLSWPPYSSWISFEVYQDVDQSSQFYIRTLYNGREMIVPNQSALCPIETFTGILTKYIPKDYDAMCQASKRPTKKIVN